MKLDLKSFRIKLWLYFILFTAIVFIVLWLLQTVFIQSFYNYMLIDNTKTAADKIAESCTDESFGDTIDELSLSNSILVYITDLNGEIIYSSDQFKGLSSKEHRRVNDTKSDYYTRNNPGSELSGRESSISDNSKTDEQSSGYSGIEASRHYDEAYRPPLPSEYRSLPEGYGEFLEALESSDSGIYENTTDGLYTYGRYLYPEGEECCVLYISTTLDAVGPAVDIIRIQLIWVTIISIVMGFVLAWFIARGFANPVARLTKKAEHIGEDDYNEEFKKGFCSELDELSEVLDETSGKLKKSRVFQRELLANVSHDLRTPLTMIKGYAEMIRDISRTDEEQCNSDVEVIVREADRLSAMVNEILEYSEMQSIENVSENEVVDMSAVVRRVCDNFKALYKSEGGEIKADIQEEIFISGDAGRFERAVYNLLDNAVNHNGDSKEIIVELKNIDGKAKLSITDHGKGIPPEELESIWDRYYTYRQRDRKGVSGLGLAIVRQIVEMYGGECRAESETGKGSTFIILTDAL